MVATDPRALIRRRAFVRRSLFKARLRGARLQLSVHPSAKVGRRVIVSVDPGSDNVLVLDAGSRLDDDVIVLLRGGTIRVGPGSSVRRGSTLNVAGEFILRERNILSYYNTVHCSQRIILEPLASASEHVTIADSRHFHGGEHDYFMENVESAPVHVGRNVWLSSKSSVLMGVTIGDDAVVAAHAVVHHDVPAKATVGGVPARVLSQR